MRRGAVSSASQRRNVAPGGTTMGWEKTTSNVGLASQGLSKASITTVQSLSAYGGVTGVGNLAAGTYTQKKFTPSQILAPNANTTFNECYITANLNELIRPCGSNIVFNNCDIELTGGSNNNERTVANVNAGFTGGATGIVFNNCLLFGGTIGINFTWDSGSVIDCYYYGQDANNNGGAQHRDGLTIRAGSSGTICRRSRFDCNQGSTTGALFLQPTYGDISGILIEDSMFEGANNCMTIEGSKNGNRTTALTIRRNRSNPYGAFAAGYAVDSGDHTFSPGYTEWSDNYAYNASNPPTYAGVAVGAP